MLGIKNGMVMQRNCSNLSEITVISEQEILSAQFYSKDKRGEIAVEFIGNNKYILRGIPVGGPYTVSIFGEHYTDIYVGDLWILAGQSNMEGAGWLEEEDYKSPCDNEIRALYMTDEWGIAKNPLHELWKAKDKVHTEVFHAQPPEGEQFRGVGPGLTFAKRMKELTGGVPQGLLCCAHGGTSMADWSEKKKIQGPDKSLYAAMQRRFIANGANAKGMFWFQGCADAFECTGDLFTERMKSFMAAFHKDFGNIPTIQVQISRVVHEKLEGLEENWIKIREAQRLIPEQIDNIYTISSINKTTDDLIHLSREAQIQLGKEGAEAMYYALYGNADYGFIPPPELHKITRVKTLKSGDVMIRVYFKNLYGGLKSLGRPNGFSLTHYQYKNDTEMIYDTRLANDFVELRTTLKDDEIRNLYLYYGFGLNPYCNITDMKDRALLAFGPISISDIPEEI